MRGFHTVTHRFQEVTRQQRVTVKCIGCGKDRVRTVTVTHTVNPFNRNDLGEARSAQEVLECVRAELAKRVNETALSKIICRTCEKTGDAASIIQRAEAAR
jgi:hypothetical protein